MSGGLRRVGIVAAVLVGVVVLAVVAAVAGFVAVTRTGVAAQTGTLNGLPLDAPVTIARDDRGIPHVRARTDHDLFFAEGYAMAADRLFQMDLTRRYTEGRLAELLGRPLIRTDAVMRSYDIERLARIEYVHAPADERRVLDAFAAGVNAAAEREPVPPEYRVLFTSFRAWRPQDAIEVGFATLLDLDDDAGSIVARDAIHRRLGQAGTDFYLPLTDPRYDVPTNGQSPGAIAPLPAAPPQLAANARPATTTADAFDDRTTLGSNGWVAGANRTSVHRAILANDPHLALAIPGVWWLFEGRSPKTHIAGAVLAGTPGVTLGHNERVAWGVTAGETAAMRLIREPLRNTDEFFEHGEWLHAQHHRETIGVRFGRSSTIDVLTTPNGTLIARDGRFAYLRDWLAARTTEDVFGPYVQLDRSRTVDDAVAAMRTSLEPALNLLAVDDTGRATYHLVGGVPDDGVWGRWAASGDAPEPPLVPFDRLPAVAPGRDALAVSSNNRPSAGALRLAPFWPSPYRAYEIGRDLAAAARANHGLLTPAALAAPQRDDTSPAERELAQLVVAAADRSGATRSADAGLAAAIAELRAFDGAMVPGSRGATLVSALRPALYRAITGRLAPDVATGYTQASASLTVVLRALRERPRGWADWDRFAVDALRDTVQRLGTPTPAFGSWAAQPLTHPLAAFGLRAWNGPTMTGRGGAYAPAVQNRGHGQSFRAEWIAGDWDASTIDVDAGESGEPGSPHYADQTARWQRFARTPLPFSDAAVRAATRSTLTLAP